MVVLVTDYWHTYNTVSVPLTLRFNFLDSFWRETNVNVRRILKKLLWMDNSFMMIQFIIVYKTEGYYFVIVKSKSLNNSVIYDFLMLLVYVCYIQY